MKCHYIIYYIFKMIPYFMFIKRHAFSYAEKQGRLHFLCFITQGIFLPFYWYDSNLPILINAEIVTDLVIRLNYIHKVSTQTKTSHIVQKLSGDEVSVN